MPIIATPYDPATFKAISFKFLDITHKLVKSALKDLEADRGPYSRTAAHFYIVFGNIYYQSKMLSQAKQIFGPGDQHLQPLADEIKKIIDQFEGQLIAPFAAIAFNRFSVVKTFFSKRESATSLITKVKDRHVDMHIFLKLIESTKAQWPSCPPQLNA